MDKKLKETLPIICEEKEEFKTLRRNLIFIIDAFEQDNEIEQLKSNFENEPIYQGLLERFSFLNEFEKFDKTVSYECMLEAIKEIRENRVLLSDDANLFNLMLSKELDKDILTYTYCALKVSLKETEKIIDLLTKFEEIVKN